MHKYLALVFLFTIISCCSGCGGSGQGGGSSDVNTDNYTLNLSTAGTGSGAVTGGGSYSYGASAKVAATADTGSTFSGWSGANGAECSTGSVAITADKSCTATFTLNSYALNLSTAGTGSGTVTGAGSYSYGATAMVIATADSGSTFAGWSGASGAECRTGSVTITADKSCTATFTLSGDSGTAISHWVVFRQADDNLSMSQNLLANADLESTSGGTFSRWNAYEGGYQAGLDEGRVGNAIRLVRGSSDAAQYGAYQTISLNRHEAKPLYFSGWSKGDNLTGVPDSNASVYLDIQYMTTADDPEHGCDPATSSPCALFHQIPSPTFDTGTHDWQMRQGFAVPAYPVKSVTFYLLLRGNHHGTLWFDDLKLAEVEATVLPFDGRVVASQAPAAPYKAGLPVAAESDGMSLSLWSEGGAMAEFNLDGAERLDPAWDFASGFFFHEATSTDWIAPGGMVSLDNGALIQRASLPEQGLEFSATTTPRSDRIDFHVEIAGSGQNDRALTIYFALPVVVPDGLFGMDVRRNRPLSGVREISNTDDSGSNLLGATGYFSVYPLATIAADGWGIALGVPLDQSRIFRLIYNPITHQLYLACDVGLTPSTVKFPNRAWVDFVLYRTRPQDAASGFRAALQAFYGLFPAHFQRRIPPEREGIWVAFADLANIQNEAGQSIEDFNVGIHETDSRFRDVAFDDVHGILTLRYLSSPAATHLRIEDGGVDPRNYEQVIGYLQELYDSGTADQRLLAEKTLSSGIFDHSDRYVYEPYYFGPPWCAGPCAIFNLSADPDISEPPYTVNQATYEWNASSMATYTSYPGLDGEFLDSFSVWATVLDLRRSHFAAVDEPLTFQATEPHALGVPTVFSTIKFARWLRGQLPAGKYLIANSMLMGAPWGSDLMDFMGHEVNWVKYSGSGYDVVPESDERLSYNRAMSYQRPYGLLMNTNFNNMSYALVERYMRICLFYGIYPSMFSPNASQNNYFETPALYQRDRPLFKKYIPLIRNINAAGWEPLTLASSDDEDVYLERFGDGTGRLFFTLRNTAAEARYVSVRLDRVGLGLSGQITVRSLLLGSPDLVLSAGEESFTVSLPAGEVELLQLAP